MHPPALQMASTAPECTSGFLVPHALRDDLAWLAMDAVGVYPTLQQYSILKVRSRARRHPVGGGRFLAAPDPCLAAAPRATSPPCMHCNKQLYYVQVFFSNARASGRQWRSPFPPSRMRPTSRLTSSLERTPDHTSRPLTLVGSQKEYMAVYVSPSGWQPASGSQNQASGQGLYPRFTAHMPLGRTAGSMGPVSIGCRIEPEVILCDPDHRPAIRASPCERGR